MPSNKNRYKKKSKASTKSSKTSTSRPSSSSSTNASTPNPERMSESIDSLSGLDSSIELVDSMASTSDNNEPESRVRSKQLTGIGIANSPRSGSPVENVKVHASSEDRTLSDKASSKPSNPSNQNNEQKISTDSASNQSTNKSKTADNIESNKSYNHSQDKTDSPSVSCPTSPNLNSVTQASTAIESGTKTTSPSSPGLGLQSSPGSPHPRSTISTLHRMLTPETPVISRSASPSTSAMASRSSSPSPPTNRVSSSSVSASAQTADGLNAKGALPLSSQFNRMYFNRTNSSTNLSGASHNIPHHLPHVPSTTIGEMPGSFGETTTSVFSPSSSSFVLASMDMSSEVPEKGHSNESHNPNLSRPSTNLNSIGTTSISPAYGRKNLSVQDLTRLVAAEKMNQAGLKSDLLSDTSDYTSRNDSNQPLASMKSLSKNSGATSTNLMSAPDSGSSDQSFQNAQLQHPVSHYSLSDKSNVSGASNCRGYSTPGKRLHSRKSLTALAKFHQSEAGSEFKPMTTDGSRSSRMHFARAASTTHLYDKHKSSMLETSHYRNPHFTSGIGLSSIGSGSSGHNSNNSRTSSRRKPSSIDLTGVKTVSELDKAQEPVLSPLLFRTGSKVWEEIRESKGRSWLMDSSRPSDKTFMVSDEDDNDSEFDGKDKLSFFSKNNIGGINRKQGEPKEEYNPLTYQSRTMIGISIDDRNTDSQSEEELDEKYDIIEESEEEEVQNKVETKSKYKKKATFKLASPTSRDSPEIQDENGFSSADGVSELQSDCQKSRKVSSCDNDSHVSRNSGSNIDASTAIEAAQSHTVYNEEQYFGDLDEEYDSMLSSISDDNEMDSDEEDGLLVDDDFQRDLIEPSHNLFIDIVDWVLGLGHESVPFTVPKAVSNAANSVFEPQSSSNTTAATDIVDTTSGATGKTEETASSLSKAKNEKGSNNIDAESTRKDDAKQDKGKEPKKVRFSKVAQAQRQAKRDIEQGLNFDVALALGCASYFLSI